MLAVPISYLEVFLVLCVYAGLVCAVTLVLFTVLSFFLFLIQRFIGRKKTPVDAPVKERGDCA